MRQQEEDNKRMKIALGLEKKEEKQPPPISTYDMEQINRKIKEKQQKVIFNP